MDKKLTESGAKALQRDDNERRDSAKPFKDWHRTLDRSWHYSDIDGVGWENVNGHWVPAFVTELTLADDHIQFVNDTYRKSILYRFFERDAQGGILCALSRLLNVAGFILLYQKNVNCIWAWSVTTKKWQELTPEQWIDLEDKMRRAARQRKLEELEANS